MKNLFLKLTTVFLLLSSLVTACGSSATPAVEPTAAPVIAATVALKRLPLRRQRAADCPLRSPSARCMI